MMRSASSSTLVQSFGVSTLGWMIDLIEPTRMHGRMHHDDARMASDQFLSRSLAAVG